MTKDSVIVFPRQSKFNIAILILLTVLVYLVVCVYSFFSKEQIVGYEVREGTLVEDNRFEAVILRDEKLIPSEATGYVSYFVTEREHIGVGKLVYTLDESGAVLDYTETLNLSENSLTKSEKDYFRETLDSFVQKYDSHDLRGMYQLDMTLLNQTQKIANHNLLNNLNNVSSLNGMVKYHYAQNSGNVVFWTDDLEHLTASEVSNTIFDKAEYEVEPLIGNRLVGAGDTVYKLFDSEKWSIAFPVKDQELAQRYLDEEVVEVTFLKNGISIWGSVSLTANAEGETVVVLDFQSGSINFATDRFLEVEIGMEDEVGLKIPVSSIVQKEFFLVPEEYVLYIEDEDAYYINVESYMETGEKSIRKLEITPYSLKDGKYYLDDANLTLGSRLQTTNSTEVYTISEKASLTGVYNMNKGYADFKQITVKQQNESYAIVESNTQYGLNVYDYIVLNANAVSEDDFIYE